MTCCWAWAQPRRPLGLLQGANEMLGRADGHRTLVGESCESCRATGRHWRLEERRNELWPFSEAQENPPKLSPLQNLRLGLGQPGGPGRS